MGLWSECSADRLLINKINNVIYLFILFLTIFSATVIVRVLDDNDNYPQFSERTYTVSVNEDINLADNPVIAHIR